MTVSTLTLRQTKGARLTTVEMDNNWLYCSDSSNATFAQSGTATRGSVAAAIGDLCVNVKSAPFSAVGDGSTDDTAAINAAITFALSVGRTVFFPAGTYVVSSTLTIDGANGISLVGDGWSGPGTGGTILKWAGNNSTPLLKLVGMQDCVLENFQILSTPSVPLSVGIQMENKSGRISGRNIVRHVWLNGTTTNGLIKGILLTPGSSDVNNDAHTFEKVRVSYASTAACSIEHTQSLIHTFIDCYFVACGVGVATDQGSGSAGGSFRWYGGFLGANTTADFTLGAVPGGRTYIHGAHSETSNRFLTTAGPTTSQYELTIDCCYFSSDAINADTKGIIYKFRGPFNFTNNRYGFGSNVPTIELAPNGEMRAWIVGNHFGATSSNGTDPITLSDAGPTSARIFRFANTYRDATKMNTRADDAFRPVNGAVILYRTEPAYGATVAIDAMKGNEFDINVTNNTNFTISNPTNATDGQRITITVRNTSGGAIGTITWDTLYKMSAWTNPANANSRSIDFRYNGTNWVQVGQTGVDVPN